VEKIMDLRHIQHFLAIAECGSLSKASTILGVAQPTLSRSVRQLEEDIGSYLFYRHGRGIRLTEEGAQFQSAVTPLVRDLLQAKDDIKGNAGVPAGAVAFGMPPSISGVIGARLVEVFLERFPQVRLQIMDGFSGYVNEWLVSGRVDMAIINSARRSANMRMEALLTVGLFHVIRRSAVPEIDRGKDTIGFQMIVGAPLVLPGRHHGLRRELDSAAQKLGAELNILVEIDALEALFSLVRRGVASTILPHGAIVRHFQDPELLIRRVVDPEVSMQFMIAYSLQRPTTLAMRELGRLVRIEVAQAIADGRMVGSMETL
jgi:LysR family transcriptional regulator, nitrogen assimilation regulatory protein